MEGLERWFSVLIALLLFYMNIDNINIKTLMTFSDYKCYRAVVNNTVGTYFILILET